MLNRHNEYNHMYDVTKNKMKISLELGNLSFLYKDMLDTAGGIRTR